MVSIDWHGDQLTGTYARSGPQSQPAKIPTADLGAARAIAADRDDRPIVGFTGHRGGGFDGAGRTRDATDKAPPYFRSYGFCDALLYNHRRQHSSLGALTPVEFAQVETEKLLPPLREKTTKDSIIYDLTGIAGRPMFISGFISKSTHAN
jgi:transposase InsO family protein